MLLYLDFPFFPIHEKDGKLGFLNVSLDYTFKFFPNFFQIPRVGKLGFLRYPLFHLLLDFSMFVNEKGDPIY